MPLARKRQISLINTPFYHCVSRCVRRAFLCGHDKYSGKSYEHRRQWVEDRLLFLGTVFCIDICAYAVMSNHTHVVLHVDKEKAAKLSDFEVATRWQKLHKSTILTQRFVKEGDEALSRSERITLASTLSVYRNRLFDISWFMRELNEHIARQANSEDKCTGHFWEGRFKSQALLDDKALAACLVYVDLNPIRANMARKPETSDHTSIKQRIVDAKQDRQPRTLLPFVGNPRQSQPKGLTFTLHDYLMLVDETGRACALNKRGTFDLSESAILKRLGFDEDTWKTLSTAFEQNVSVAAGNVISLERYKTTTKRKRLPNRTASIP